MGAPFYGIKIGIDPPDDAVLGSRPARGRAAMPENLQNSRTEVPSRDTNPCQETLIPNAWRELTERRG